MKPEPELVAAQHGRVPCGAQARRVVVEHEDVIAVADEAAELQVAASR
jgi:hypothetical protein